MIVDRMMTDLEGSTGKMAKKKIVARKKDATAESDQPFEESLGELGQVVQDLESGQLTLTESLTRYEEGVGLLKQCYQSLQKAERKIELLSGLDAEGRPITQDFDDADETLEEKAENRSKRRGAASPKRKGTPQNGPKNEDSDEDDSDEEESDDGVGASGRLF